MPQEVIRQVSFNGGELDPRMRGRRDLKTYYAMVELGENISISPLGPANRRPGTWFVDYCRHRLVQVDLTVPMLTLPNGPIAAEDYEPLVTASGEVVSTIFDLGAADHGIVIVDFGAPTEVHLIDVVDYFVAAEEDVEAAAPPPFVYPYEPPVFDGPIDVGPIGGDIP